MRPDNPALRGVALMVLAVGTFVCMDTIAKYLSRHYPVSVIVWARYAINLLLMLAFLAARGELRYARTARPGIQILRGLLLGASTLLFFTALSKMPVAEATAIGFVMPLFVAVLAVLMLKERLDMPPMVAILVGLIGALVIVRPGSAVFTVYALLPLAAALGSAFSQILTRKIAGIEPPMTSLFYGALVGTVMFGPALLWWEHPPAGLWHWSLLVALGLLATVGHFALIRAFDYGTAMLLSPFVYTQLVWAMLLGLLVFGDFPDAWSLTGMAIIVASGLYLANRQRFTVRRDG